LAIFLNFKSDRKFRKKGTCVDSLLNSLKKKIRVKEKSVSTATSTPLFVMKAKKHDSMIF